MTDARPTSVPRTTGLERSSLAAAGVSAAGGTLAVMGYLGLAVVSFGLLLAEPRSLYVELLATSGVAAVVSLGAWFASGPRPELQLGARIRPRLGFGVVAAALPVLLGSLR